MRLIDADRLKEVFRRNTGHDYSEFIDIQPTVDVLEQIRGEIDGIEINGQINEHTMFIRSGNEVKKIALDIIDKYIKEQTNEEHNK